MQMPSSINDQIKQTIAACSDKGFSDIKPQQLGDTWDSIVNALPQIATAGINAFASVTSSANLAKVGILPTSYSANGLPIYASTPAGVTPNNPYSLPSGMVLPAGVTPAVYATPILPSSLSGFLSTQNLLPLAMVAGGALLLVLILRKV